jgi:hypothetical protein
MLNVYRVAEWVLRTVLTLNWAFHDQFGINVNGKLHFKILRIRKMHAKAIG